MSLKCCATVVISNRIRRGILGGLNPEGRAMEKQLRRPTKRSVWLALEWVVNVQTYHSVTLRHC